MTRIGPEGKDFSDKQYREMGINPDELRSKPPIFEWAKRLEHLEPVELSSDPVVVIRIEREARPGSRLDRLIKLTSNEGK